VQYWQIASGSFGRDYTEDFLKFGMAFVGGEDQRRMMKEVQCGDRVILKKGKYVMAVGVVEARDGKCQGDKGDGEKQWLSEEFDGWDLSAYCFIAWREIKPRYHAPELTIATIQRVRQPHLIEWAKGCLASLPVRERADEPPQPDQVDDDDILKHLIKQGLRVGAAEELTIAFKRIRLLAQYYYDKGDEWVDVREHETRTFLIIPLLLALGWAEQQIKIELPVSKKRRVDIACFRAGPFTKKREDVVMLIETKGFSQGLDDAVKQAKLYAKHFRNCQLMVATNGYCYKTFERDTKGDYSRPSAYLNLLHPRNQYTRDPEVGGCLKALELLLPSSRMQNGRRQAPAQQ